VQVQVNTPALIFFIRHLASGYGMVWYGMVWYGSG
jgi:hypothetical protein